MPVVRRLADRILFRVYAETFLKMFAALDVSGATRTSARKTVFYASGGSVVAGGYEMVGLHDDRGDLTARAVGAFCDYLRNLHEIFVPSRARIIYGGFLFHVAYFSTFSPLCVAIASMLMQSTSSDCHRK